MSQPEKQRALSSRRDALTDAQRARLAERLRGNRQRRTINRADRGQPLPLSFMQEQVFAHQALDPASIAYHRPGLVRMQGPLDVGALERTVTALVRRHETLRTVIRQDGEQPRQEILPAWDVRFSLVDLSTEPDPTAAANRLIQDEARRPFALQDAVLWRCQLLRYSDQEHALFFTFHHLIFDHWSEAVLLQDLSACYAACVEGLSPNWPDLPIQYVDYAAWQRTQSTTVAHQRGLQFWRESLRDLPTLALPTDRPKSNQRDEAGDAVSVQLPAELVDELRRLGQQEDVTPFMMLLAAWSALLSRETGQADIVIGVPVAGRVRPEFEGLIGAFINTLPLRLRLSGAETFRELLRISRDAYLAAIAHQDVSLLQIVRQIVARQGRGGWPGFDAMLIYERATQPHTTPNGLTFQAEECFLDVATADLSLELTESTTGISGRLIYRRALWDRAEIEQLASLLVSLLTELAAQPDAPVSVHRDQPAGTLHHRQIDDWNATERDFDRDVNLAQLIERQVARTPDAVAVVCDGHTVTYSELNRRANRLARCLRKCGAQPEALIAVCMDRTPDLVTVLVAILKSGAAYLPLDPSHPPQRRAQLLGDAGAALLLTDASLRDRLPSDGPIAICLDRDAARWADESEENLEPAAGPENLAYVIYTSGSTGKPKGVEIPHRAVVNLLQAMQRCPGMSAGELILAITTVTFDISVMELFLPLICGGGIELVRREVAMDGFRLKETIERSPASLIQATPTTWRMLLEAGWMGRPSLKLITGGETLPSDLARALLPCCGELWNLYGPTETTVWSMAQRIQSPDARITVGKPIANTRAYILDRQLQPLPVGVPGELFLGGESVARGYRGRPDLTLERFLPDPFVNRPGARIYRTGDLARFLTDGTIEHLGRLDRQIKLRGHRIEPGEIEAILCEHPAVAAAVVILWGIDLGEPLLAAYVVTHARCVTSRELRELLAARLPPYMVPASIMFLERLPVTSSGKVDRRALPSPDVDCVPNRETVAATQGPLEELLAETWCEVLGRERIGRDDNFFELGGHSLMALRVVARCRPKLAAEFPVALLFQYPTIAGLVQALGPARLRSSPESHAVAPKPVHHDSRPFAIPTQPLPKLVASSLTPPADAANRLPLALPQQRLFFLNQLGGQETVYNIAQAWQLDGPLEVEAFRRALETIVARHEPLRTIYGLDDGAPYQSVQPLESFALPVHDLCHLSEPAQADAVRLRAAEEAETPFQLATDLMLRAQLLRTAERQHVLLLTMHHIASDGFSLQVFWQELKRIYETLLRGEVLVQGDLPCRFSDFVTWQLGESRSAPFQAELEYWQSQLNGLPPLELPTDRPRPNWSSHRGARRTFRLDGELTSRLRAFSRQAGTTLHITLLTAFQILLYRYSQQDDFAVGVPILGRLKPEFERLIGMFVNTLVIRTRFEAASTFRRVLAQVNETSLAAYDHQQVPFERLVEELHPERHGGRSPLVQTLFQLLDLPEPESLYDVAVSRRAMPTQRCHTDLELLLRPQGDELDGELVYSTELFDDETIRRLAEHYRILLAALLAEPDAPLQKLPLMSAVERQLVLVEWNSTARDYPELCVHQLFERQAQQRPQAVALVDGDRSWTYAELNCRANRLAHRLRARGVGVEARVGISAERSPEMIVGVLAILKAGGAYVPLDPQYPPERLAYLVSDSGASLILASSGQTEAWRGLAAPVIPLDEAPEPFSDFPETAPASEVTPDNLIYVIYTSGSTGVPKGVEVLHRGVVRLVCGADYVDLDKTQSVLQLATLSFDASTFEIWAPLLNGGRCVLAPPQLLDPIELQRLLQREHIRTLWLTSTFFNALVDEFPAALEGLDQLLIGGEALSVPHIYRAQQRLGPRTQIINGYGPTECTTFACCYRLPSFLPAECSSIPIGRPIANTTAYVLDAVGQPTPIGIPGELHLGGAGLARGYRNRQELTAERFVPNPFSDDPAGRLYRTGDRVRWRADGCLEFLGRLDEQVKIRGYRIEPGEIESVLRQHPNVADAVVIARKDPTVGGYQLAAYLLAKPASADWRNWLSARMPAYMIPAHFVELDQFPRTPGGKVDRRLLPEPSPVEGKPSGSTAPQTALEEEIARIWREALQRPQLSRDDDFFDLGGHSLLALRVAARLSKALHRNVPVALFFRHSTVAAMAQALEGPEFASATDFINELKPGDNAVPLILFSALGAELFSARHLAQALPTAQAVYGVDWHAGREVVGDRSLHEIAMECAKRIREFHPAGPYCLTGYSFGGRLAYETACCLVDNGATVALLAIIDAGPGGAVRFTGREQVLGCVRLLRNLPRWFVHDLLADSPKIVAGRISRKARQLWRRLTVRSFSRRTPAAETQIEDLFDPGAFPRWFQARQQADLLAAAQHQARPAPVKVTFFRSRIRPLLHGHLTDLAWRHLAQLGVEVHEISGHHGSMMRPPQVDELILKLGTAVEAAAESVQTDSGAL